MGKWNIINEILFSRYIFMVSSQINNLITNIRNIYKKYSKLIKMLGYENEIISLYDREIKF